ncbi:MAG: hypothetical protein ACOYXC_06485 [Candidatus Rifleibacteriota bacterium]
MKIKKIVLIIVAVTFLFNLPVCGQEKEIEMTNALNYHKSMLGAMKSVDLLKVPFGNEISVIGGPDQDTENLTEGVPYAFRVTAEGDFWILDSANRALKLFGAEGRLKNSISLSNMGRLVRDFAFGPDGGFWLLSPIEGFIYQIDREGKIVNRIEGFCDARALETGVNDSLLVDMPLMNSVLRFGADGVLGEQISYENGLSLHEGIGGKLLGIEMDERNVKLNMRTVASPAQTVTLAEFPLDIEDQKVSYAGAEILGRDASGSIYLNLIACHEDGPIYRDRLYRCNQLGKPVAFTDIIAMPYLAPDLPRSRIVAPDGRVVVYYVDKQGYVLAGYSITQP